MHYAAPEQLERKGVDDRTDVRAAALVFMEVATTGIELNGTSGPLQFDANGRVSSFVQVWCVAPKSQSSAPWALESSGRYLDPAQPGAIQGMGSSDCP